MRVSALFSVFTLFSVITATKFNYPRILLPIFEKISVNFTVEIIDRGCFAWSTSRSDLVQIVPVFDEINAECSHTAIVTPVLREKERSTAVVLAENLATGEVARCDVILDVIDQLGVLTTTRELYLEEAPESFELMALDSQGNAFTTLEGVEFTWQIISQHHHTADSKDNWRQVMRFLTFSESNYHQVPKTMERFEFLGLTGYMTLLEGINTGSAKVRVSLPYKDYDHVPAIEVDIMILANILLSPSDVHVLVGDAVEFRVFQLKRGKLEEIDLNSQYYLEAEDPNLVAMHSNMAKGRKLGRTSVLLRDRNIPHETDESVRKPSPPRAIVTVSNAVKIGLSLLPYNNWITVEGERHEIAIDLFTADDQKITLGVTYNVDSSFDQSYFQSLSMTANGTRIYGEALRKGSTPVVGSFRDLEARAEMQIYERLNLSPRFVLIPYDPNSPKRQKIDFVATGGDGNFVWSSLNNNLVAVNQNGVAETRLDHLKGLQLTQEEQKSVEKLTQIRVALARNPKIFKSSDILFRPPVKLEIVKYNFETALNDVVQVHVALYAMVNETLQAFTHCENIDFALQFSSQLFTVEALKEPPPLEREACKLINLRAKNLGSTSFEVSYNFLGSVLSDTVKLVVFEKLTILNPVANEVVLPIGASRNVIYHNGPQKLFHVDAELLTKVSYTKSVISVTKSPNVGQEKTVFRVLCKKIGETDFTFEIYNHLSEERHRPYVSQFITRVFCVKPRFLRLSSREQLRESCPLKNRMSLMQIQGSSKRLEVDIEVFDASNRRLANISSLHLDWEFLHGSEQLQDVSYRQESQVELVEDIAIPDRDLLYLAPPEVNADFRIRGRVTKYVTEVLAESGIKGEHHFGVQKSASEDPVMPTIEDELSFLAVNHTLLPYNDISIFLGQKVPSKVQILQGSGFYETKLDEKDIVDVQFDENFKELSIRPKRIGQVRLSLMDRCLTTEDNFLLISVVSIGRIDIKMPDRVERTKSIEAIVTLFDSNNRILAVDASNLPTYDLTEEIAHPHLVSVRLGRQVNLNPGEVRYEVTGQELGETTLVVSSGHAEKRISSNPANIQVFPPLRLQPRNVTILVGASVQIYAVGGPHPDVNIVYSVEKADVISLEASLVRGEKLGETTVTGRAMGVNPRNGQAIVLSEDVVHVRVIPLDGVKIRAPLVRLRSGNTMPAAIWGVPNLSPMVLGTLDNLKVYWSTNQPDVVEISGVFAEIGVKYSEKDAVTVRIRGKSPGKATIHAKVITPHGNTLTSRVEVSVFRLLELESPRRITSDTILIPPQSSVQLKANLDEVTYAVDTSQRNFVTVSSSGLVKSSENTGLSLIVATADDQSLSIPIEVKPIHYVLVTLHPVNLKLRSVESKIPQGLNVRLKVSLHDNIGNEFSHNLNSVSSLQWNLAQRDLIDVHTVDNFILDLSLTRETTNMLSIGLKDILGVKYSEDFVKLSVQQMKTTFPDGKIVTVGDIVCFESALTTTASWFSSDDSLISIDQDSGVAIVTSVGTGKVSIFHGSPNFIQVTHNLEVREANQITFATTFDIFNGEMYRAPLVIRNHVQTTKTSNLLSLNSSCHNQVEVIASNFFSCRLSSRHSDFKQLPDFFRTQAIFDPKTISYACQIEPRRKIDEIISVVKNEEINLELEAVLMAGHSDTMSLRLIPAISVAPSSISVDQIPTQGIAITGLDKVLQKVEVQSSDPTVLQVGKLEKTQGMVQSQLKLLAALPEDDTVHLKISSPLTKQTIEVPVLSPLAARKCSRQAFNLVGGVYDVISNLGLIVSFTIILGIILWAFVSYSNRRSTNLNPQVFNRNGIDERILTAQALSSSPGNGTRRTSPFPSASPGSSPGRQFVRPGQDTIIYGDTTLISPERRSYRRYL
ncbi:nuclear pore membrane glycoprotein 210 [Phlebotomus argentipes]|uniref:nuclear pore membrane glycoprotein 210 n=1 Tax=Phlebotomus argentipes TaxID=94469 RepID=UPI0028934338|nr:nuclear pore membrane glycoprotein 210 [Phlebotomus argentipes]